MLKNRFQNIGWTVGNYCNAKCLHCYSWKVRKDSKEFLSLPEIDLIINKLKCFGVKTLNLGGNEPIYTNGPDLSKTTLPYILRELKENNIPVGLTTNSVSFKYLQKNFKEELLLLNDIDFSLDFPTKEQHNANRGIDLFDSVIRSIRDCKDIGIDCSIIFCAQQSNFDLPNLKKFLDLASGLDCELRVNILKPVSPEMKEKMPTLKQFYEGYAYLLANTDCITLGESCLSSILGINCNGCPCGNHSFRINGKTKEGKVPISPCVYAHDFRTGDLLTQSLDEITSSAEFERFNSRRLKIPKACIEVDCPFLETCRGGCTSSSYLYYNDLDSRDPYCFKEYLSKYGKDPIELLTNPSFKKGGLRVHDNYLCTWIGKPKK
jgi:radical SAM protein with 4Fe4S-binding SPASM domain